MTGAADNLRGAALMTAAMAGFAIEDMALKAAGRELPVGQMLVVFGAVGLLVFHALIRRRGERLIRPETLSRPILIRAGCEVAGRLFYTLAIVLTPLSAASAILQAAPLVVVAGAALMFGERVGLRRWLAIFAGFAGVLIILRPGAEGFSALSLLAVAGTLGFAGRDLATRAAPRSLSSLHLGAYGFAMLIPTGAGLLLVTGTAPVEPSASAVVAMAVASAFGILAYHGLTLAMRTGEVSAVTPFRYTRLVFALVLGTTVFGESPDAVMLSGCALVVLAGIYALTARNGSPG